MRREIRHEKVDSPRKGLFVSYPRVNFASPLYNTRSIIYCAQLKFNTALRQMEEDFKENLTKIWGVDDEDDLPETLSVRTSIAHAASMNQPPTNSRAQSILNVHIND